MNKFSFSKIILPCILIVSVVCATFALGGKVSGEPPVYTGDIKVTNPEMNFITMDTSENDMVWVPISSFEQGNGKYTIRSNTYCAWYQNDDIAFAYNQFNIGSGKNDKLEYRVTVNSHKPDTKGVSVLHQNASIGIMMRDSLDPNGAEVFLHIRPQGVMMVYRPVKGDASFAKYTSIGEQYPTELKLVREGKKFTGYYRKAGTLVWSEVASCAAVFNGPTYAGLAQHSIEEKVIGKAVCSEVQIEGNGTYSGNTEEDNTTSSKPEEVDPGPEDAPASENILLRETFSDGSLTDGKESKTNPIWKDTTGKEIIYRSENNRVLSKEFADGYDFIGDQHWTDYEASVDVEFTNLCNAEAKNVFSFYFRHIEQNYYGCFDYYVSIESCDLKVGGAIQKDEAGNVMRTQRMVLYKRQRAKFETAGTALVTIDNIGSMLGDGKLHTLKVKAIDNHLIVFLDGKEMIDYYDEAYNMNLKGNVGIETANTAVYIDNITVTKIEDTLGGDYDNYIGGRFNEPAPEYVDDMGIPLYEFTEMK
ncbi:MAG: hypothetical protein IJP22_03835 [Clostridia bacterium]|nr:hypothetical protein [Clostridia bacterium]